MRLDSTYMYLCVIELFVVIRDGGDCSQCAWKMGEEGGRGDSEGRDTRRKHLAALYVFCVSFVLCLFFICFIVFK